MSTLAEIEEAADKLPRAEQAALLTFLSERLARQEVADDPVAEIIGAFPSAEPNDTGRQAEEILYGHDKAK